MRKLLRFIFGLIGTIILLVIIAIVVLFFMLKDDTVIKPENIAEDHNRAAEVVLGAEIEKSMHDVTSTKNVDFTLDETALEYLFTAIVEQLDLQLGNDLGITGVDIDVKDENFSLEAAGKIFFFSTVVRCKLGFEETEEAFVIHLNDLKAGSLDFLTIGRFLTWFIDVGEAEKALAENKIYCEIDLKDYKVTFTKENVKRMMVESLGEEQKELVNVLADIFLDNDEILELNLGKGDLLGAILHLDAILYDEASKGALPYGYDFDGLRSKTEELLDNGLIAADKVGAVYNYLVNGYSIYQKSEEAENKNYIDSLDLSSIGIEDKRAYRGVFSKPAGESAEILAGFVADSFTISLEQMLLERGFNIVITDGALTEALKTVDLIGFSAAFCNDETGDVGYIVVEQLNIICESDRVVVDLIANINGEQIYIEIKLDVDENNGGLSLTGAINSVSIGRSELSASNVLSLLRYLETATEGVEWLRVQLGEAVASSRIVFDFSQIMNGNDTVTSFISRMAQLSLSVTHNTKVVDGGIVIGYLN